MNFVVRWKEKKEMAHLARFYRTVATDAHARQALANLQDAGPSSYSLDAELVFYVQFSDGAAFASLPANGV
jgi:hypothetical protein